ncbi:MAG: hypothetical protein HN683_09145 [Gammaproteobacteria bacterium]|jgi:amidophosphoribosyltransferase|nr:hypothetical protein [Gammaproteobacteria bacterium]
MPAVSEFAAHGHTEAEIAEQIGVDWLIYQDLEDLEACALGVNDKISRFDTSVFDGEYVAGGIDESYLKRIESLRNDQAKSQESAVEMELIEIHNQS